jgi:hypothetical protein
MMKHLITFCHTLETIGEDDEAEDGAEEFTTAAATVATSTPMPSSSLTDIVPENVCKDTLAGKDVNLCTCTY